MLTDPRYLRDRHADLVERWDRSQSTYPAASPSLVVQTVTFSSYPTTADVYYCVELADPGGIEAENESGSFNEITTSRFYALNLGSAIPPTGTKLIVHLVGGRWCFRWDS